MRHYLLFALFFFLLQSSSTRAEESYLYSFCDSPDNYASWSKFEKNLNLLLSSLTATAPTSRDYTNYASGRQPHQIYGLAQCQGDVSQLNRQDCLNTAAAEIFQQCPNKKNAENASDQSLLDQTLGTLMYGLPTTAAYDSSNDDKFAANSTAVDGYTGIYGLVECARDLSNDDCHSCLQAVVDAVLPYGIGGQAMSGYEIHPFYAIPPAATSP